MDICSFTPTVFLSSQSELRTCWGSASASKSKVPRSGVELAEDGLDLITFWSNDGAVRAGLGGVQNIDTFRDGLWECCQPSEGNDAIASDRVHLDKCDVDGWLSTLTPDESCLIRESEAVKGRSREEIDGGRGVTEMGVSEKVLGIVLVKFGQGEDEVVHDLVSRGGRNAVIPPREGKSAGGGESEDGSRCQNIGEMHLDGVFLRLAMKRMCVPRKLSYQGLESV